MGFRFAARTVLELGKELISSDEVAIYELIKNAVDAGSPKIEIEAQIILRQSSYVQALEELDDGSHPSNVMETVRQGLMETAPQGPVREFLDRLQRYETSPSRFRIALQGGYARHNWIQVSDTGAGMTLAQLDDVFLTIGTRSRRSENIEGARYLGDKGVGRLSTMRLGDRLLVVSATADQTFWGRLRINWTLFSHDREIPLEQINITPVRGTVKAGAADQGTTIRVSALAADWTPGRFDDVMRGRIARMVDPFSGLGQKLLIARYNGDRVLIPSVPKKLLDAAHATCHIRFTFEKDEALDQDVPVLTATMRYDLRDKDPHRDLSWGRNLFPRTARFEKAGKTRPRGLRKHSHQAKSAPGFGTF